jgi:hypothetical protein
MMTNRNRMLAGPGSLAVVFLVSGCGTGPDGEREDVGSSSLAVLTEQNIRPKSVVARERLPTGHWQFWGTMRRALPGEQPPKVVADESSGIGVDLSAEQDRMAIGTATTGDVYSVQFAAHELRTIVSALERKGFANGNSGDYPPDDEESFIRKAWSNGIDDRDPEGIHENGLSPGGFARNGQLDNHCSATFIGNPETDYYVITAAHCLFAGGSGDWLDPTFRPRRDSCRTNTGAAIADCVTSPYGAWHGGQYMTYQYFLDNCRGATSLSTACQGRDIAVVRVSRPSGFTQPGAHGFGNFSETTIKANQSYNRGYPNCGGTGDPDASGGSAGPNNVCRANTLYGTLGTISTEDESGRRVSNNMDSSPGMSGSSLYIYSPGASVYAVQVAQVTGCFAGCTIQFPNRAAKISSTFYGWILDFMGI